MRKSILLGLAIAVAGCSYKMQTPFNAVEYSRYEEAGTGVVTGQAFLRQVGGSVVTCAGSEVLAIPSTAYTTELVNASYVRTRFEFGDPAAQSTIGRVTRHGQCDSQGNFSVSGLPAGPWHIVTRVSWQVGYNYQGGVVSKLVNVEEGKTQNIIITR